MKQLFSVTGTFYRVYTYSFLSMCLFLLALSSCRLLLMLLLLLNGYGNVYFWSNIHSTANRKYSVHKHTHVHFNSLFFSLSLSFSLHHSVALVFPILLHIFNSLRFSGAPVCMLSMLAVFSVVVFVVALSYHFVRFLLWHSM